MDFSTLRDQLPPLEHLNSTDLNGTFSNLSFGYFPPDSACVPFVDEVYPDLLGVKLCPVTNDMVSFLNLTESLANYIQAYCLNPPDDDGCPYGWCPNADIAAPLIRIPTYLVAFFVTIIIYYEPEALAETFWSQLLTVYSLLITSVVSISKSELTRIHAVMATGLTGSPLSIYIFVYAIRSLWGGGDRMHIILGKGRILSRTLVLMSFALWAALIFYILKPGSEHFAQRSCEKEYSPLVFRGFFFLPIVLITLLFRDRDTREVAGALIFLAGLPLACVAAAWLFAIIRRRKDIWPAGQPWRFRAYKVWRTVVDNYPYLQFLSVVLIPLVYWVILLEMGALISNDSNKFEVTFGGILACFAVVPPLLQIIQMLPRLWRWFVDLRWVRFITCRPKRQRGPSTSSVEMGMKQSQSNGSKYYLEPLVLDTDGTKSHSRMESTLYQLGDITYTYSPREPEPRH